MNGKKKSPFLFHFEGHQFSTRIIHFLPLFFLLVSFPLVVAAQISLFTMRKRRKKYLKLNYSSIQFSDSTIPRYQWLCITAIEHKTEKSWIFYVDCCCRCFYVVCCCYHQHPLMTKCFSFCVVGIDVENRVWKETFA